jgi:hypothetical protein
MQNFHLLKGHTQGAIPMVQTLGLFMEESSSAWPYIRTLTVYKTLEVSAA